MFIYSYLQMFNKRCTNPGRSVALTARYYMVRCDICGFSAWEMLHVTLLAPSILRWRLDFLKLLDPCLMVSYEVTLNLRVTKLKNTFFL